MFHKAPHNFPHPVVFFNDTGPGNKQDAPTPLHIFHPSGKRSVSFGRDTNQCDVVIPTEEAVDNGVSSTCLTLTARTPSTLHLSVQNRFPLRITGGKEGDHEVGKGGNFDIVEEHLVTIAPSSNFSLSFFLPQQATPLSDLPPKPKLDPVEDIRDQHLLTIRHIESTVKTWESALMAANTSSKLDAANKVYGLAISMAISQLCPPPALPSLLQISPRKRLAEVDFPIPYTIKRPNTGDTEHRQFLEEQRKARKAREDVRAYGVNSRGHRELVQSALECLRATKKKKCFFFRQGRCLEGDACLFMHAAST